MRRTALLLAPAVALVGAAACAPFHAGAAATVGDTRISTQQLRHITDVDVALAASLAGTPVAQASQNGGAKATDLQRTVLTFLVERQLVRAGAARLGVTVDANAIGLARTSLVTQLDQLRDRADQSAGNVPAAVTAKETPAAVAAFYGVDLDLYAEITAYQDAVQKHVATPAAVSAFLSGADPRVVIVDQVVTDPDTAARIVATAQGSAQRLQAAAAQLPEATQAQSQSGGDPFQAAFTAADFAARVGNVPVQQGGVIGPIALPGGSSAVYGVLGVSTPSESDALQDGSAVQAALARAAFAPYAGTVRISPRFGSWKPYTNGGLGSIGDLSPARALSTVGVGSGATGTTGTTMGGTGTGSSTGA